MNEFYENEALAPREVPQVGEPWADGAFTASVDTDDIGTRYIRLDVPNIGTGQFAISKREAIELANQLLSAARKQER
ncbi:hypothetical protein [Burkholderia pseudomallei]|uniref:hypothetical protein n=1 Tax=Burkholderia pseudomallei TaxID=28450 RepID=UPI0012F4F3FF|nr:hypothetical protein [Burkholderia pseudomallei]